MMYVLRFMCMSCRQCLTVGCKWSLGNNAFMATLGLDYLVIVKNSSWSVKASSVIS